jgi:ADP-ribose pyrophosphatase YjhB (NUDIX family)
VNESGRDTSKSTNTKNRGQGALDFGVRVGAVVESGGKLLIVGHEKPGESRYWVLPGGRLEPGETVPECAGRELAEETGLAGEFAEVLYVSEFLREGRHTVDITARVEIASETEAVLGSDPETPPDSAPTLVELAWVTPAELSGLDLRPAWIRDRLVRDASRGWPRDAVYLEGGDG